MVEMRPMQGLLRLRSTVHGSHVRFTLYGLGSEARAGGEAKCEASHKIHITITAILHNTDFSLRTPRLRVTRDAARKVLDTIAVANRLRARFQYMH